MSKKRASAEIIQATMQKWIAESASLGGECGGCAAPTPMPLLVPQKGCNWTESYTKVLPGCQNFISEIIERAKAEYDLA